MKTVENDLVCETGGELRVAVAGVMEVLERAGQTEKEAGNGRKAAQRVTDRVARDVNFAEPDVLRCSKNAGFSLHADRQ